MHRASISNPGYALIFDFILWPLSSHPEGLEATSHAYWPIPIDVTLYLGVITVRRWPEQVSLGVPDVWNERLYSNYSVH